MLIAKKGNYELIDKIFLGREPKTTFSIEICKRINDSLITICTLNRGETNLISCENRLLSTIENLEDLENVKLLVDILYLIFRTDEVKKD